MLAVMAERKAERARADEAEAAHSGAALGGGRSQEVARERALLAKSLSGDRAALAQLLNLHARDVAAVCYHVAGPENARDATQEALFRIVRELAQFDASRGELRAWMMAVARNVCRDGLRRRGRERAAFVGDGAPHTEAAPASTPDPERLVIARQRTAALSVALEGLPAPMREALVMFHVGDATYEEIATTLRVPMGTVMTWLHRGRQRLRAALEEP